MEQHGTTSKTSSVCAMFRVWIECDEVEHGIAAAWKAFADKYATD